MLLLASSVCGLFKWRQFEPEVILLAVGWYLRFSLSYRDVEELLAERGLLVDQVTVRRWVQRYAPELNRRLRSGLKPTNDSWRVDETYIRVKGKWVYLYRAVDSSGATIDFFCRPNAMQRRPGAFWLKPWASRIIRHRGSSTPIRMQLTRRPSSSSKPRALWRSTPAIDRCNISATFWNRIIGRSNAAYAQASIWGAWRTIAGYEAIHMIRKGQAWGSAACAKVGLLHASFWACSLRPS
jgi:IS6 family transposase